jgi:hypothetical protein
MVLLEAAGLVPPVPLAAMVPLTTYNRLAFPVPVPSTMDVP